MTTTPSGKSFPWRLRLFHEGFASIRAEWAGRTFRFDPVEPVEEEDQVVLTWHQLFLLFCVFPQPLQPLTVLNRFHWTSLMPLLYTLILLFMACLSGFFSISGLVFFSLFLLHSFAYYAFRGKLIRSSDNKLSVYFETSLL